MEVPEWEETDVMASSTTRESAWMVIDCSSREDKRRRVVNSAYSRLAKVKVWVVLWAVEWVVSAAKREVWAAMVAAGEAIGSPIDRYFDNQNDFKQLTVSHTKYYKIIELPPI